jgi:putative transposase
MPQLYYNKYRIPSTRLRHWNYANEGMYFITICTKNKENYFGEIVDSRVVDLVVDTRCIVGAQCIACLQPTKIGQIAYDEWLKTPLIRPDMNLQLGDFVVMPNHFHAIITIGPNEYNDTGMERRDVMHRVPTNDSNDNNHPHATGIKYKNQFSPQSKNLASIIRGYKSAVTTFARKNGIPFEWQPRYHDHIIRSHDEYRRISRYIIDNPAKWLNPQS